eukprot:810300-Pleurochrysis_carterae.AAC.2
MRVRSRVRSITASSMSPTRVVVMELLCRTPAERIMRPTLGEMPSVDTQLLTSRVSWPSSSKSDEKDCADMGVR